jgi:acyl-CoA synthetase (AMP-forming)/AMP-acid ligase II
MVDALQHTIQHLIDAYQLTEKDRILLVMPLFHVHGLIGNLLITLFSGGEAIIPPKFSAHHFLEQADQGQATWFSAVPTIYRILLTKPEYLENEMLSRVRSRLRFIRSCSAALPHDLRITMTSVFKVPILQAYAMTEAAHLVATGLINDNNCPEASVGKPLGCTVVILDDERTCLSDKVGEICVKGYGIMKGYLKPKSANLTAFSKDGLFRTGDLGSIDASGYLHVQGRIKELINRGGEKINPHEIDAVLQASPLVHEAITFPLPDDIYGEIPACVIVLESNVNVQTAKEQLCAHCREHLALFKCPARLIFTESIPKSAIGKVQRAHLTKYYSS